MQYKVESSTCPQPIDVALRDEGIFLKKRYPLLAGRNGTPFLAKRLNKVCIVHSSTDCEGELLKLHWCGGGSSTPDGC